MFEVFCNFFCIVCINYCYDSCIYVYCFYIKYEVDIEEFLGVCLLVYFYNNFYVGLYKFKVYWMKDCKKRCRSCIFVICECFFMGVVLDEIIL